MTREEEIRQAGIEYTCKNRPKCIGGDAFSKVIDGMNRNLVFEDAAKWADKTMIEKACEILARMVWEVTYEDLQGDSTHHYDKMEFIEDFRKAMEE